MPVLKNGDDRFERGAWQSFKRKLIADTELTLEEAKRRKAIAEMLLAEFAVDRQINQRAPEAAWHHQLGWLHPAKSIEAAKAAVEAGDTTREKVADTLGADLGEVDAENARDRARQDQMSPGTWTTLPKGFDPDNWPFDVTDPEPTTAGIDVQTTGGKVRIDLAVGDRTTSIEAEPEAAARLLRDMDLAQRGY